MNEQQLQQILTIQQAIAAAATAAVINSLLNPQQAAGLTNANALTDLSSTDIQQQQQQQQQQQHDSRQSPADISSPPALQASDCNSQRIQDLLLQLQQQASMGQSPLALNLNALSAPSVGATTNIGSPIRSPVSARLAANQELNAATTSNTNQQTNSHKASPIKKLKRHHHNTNTNNHHHHLHSSNNNQAAFHNRSSEATSKPQHHSSPKNHSTISSLNNSRNSLGHTTTTTSNNSIGNNTSSSSSSAFISNNVGLPRKLVRGQDVWLGRGAEQTRQILKCMWCGQSFRTLAEMTQHMKITQHYTNIISQEQITSWRQPEGAEANNKHTKQSSQVRGLDESHDDFSDKLNESEREDNLSNDEDFEQNQGTPGNKSRLTQNRASDYSSKSDLRDNNSSTGLNHGDSSTTVSHIKSLSSSKPLTRSRRRETETLPIKRDLAGRETSPTTSSSSQQRQNRGSSSSGASSNSGNLILGDLNEDSKTNKQEQSSDLNGTDSTDHRDEADAEIEANASLHENQGAQEEEAEDDDGDDNYKRDENRRPNGDSAGSERSKDSEQANVADNVRDDIADGDNDEDDDVDDDDDDVDSGSRGRGDIDARDADVAGTTADDEQSETNESAATTATLTTSAGLTNSTATTTTHKGDSGNPLSELETMVVNSFNPRIAPGVANGGILQRLGIDEEVGPPWHNISYFNWYTAAACQNPAAAAAMAMALNGIKLSKNVDPRRTED